MIEAIYFYIFATVLVLSSLMVVFARNPVSAVLFLILAFFNAASLFIMQGAEFIGMMLVIVYVGAVAVLFLFVVMMLDVDFSRLRKTMKKKNLALSVLVGVTLVAELVLVYASWEAKQVKELASPTPDPSVTSNVHALGEILYTQYVYPFQIAGFILLVAMIGAITLALRHVPETRKQDISKQVGTRRSDVVKMVKVKTGAGVEI